MELEDVDSMWPDAIRENLRFTKEFREDVDRMAVVTTDPLWRNLSDFVSKPAGKALGVDVERFDDRVGAWKWIRGES